MRRVKSAPIFAPLIFLSMLAGCSKTPAKPDVYKMTGTVLSVQLPSHQATIQHDSIPGVMEAMTMPYLVRDDAVLQKLVVGDQIKADVMVNKETGEIWLANVQVTKPASNK